MKYALQFPIDCSRPAHNVQPREEERSGLAQAVQDEADKDFFDMLGIAASLARRDRIVVIPPVKPIAHPQDGVDDEPRLALHELAMFLAFANQFDKSFVLAGHHGDEFVLALAGERIEFVEE